MTSNRLQILFSGCARAVDGFVSVRSAEELRTLCKALLMLPGRRIDQRRTDGFREHISSVLWRSCAPRLAITARRPSTSRLRRYTVFHKVIAATTRLSPLARQVGRDT